MHPIFLFLSTLSVISILFFGEGQSGATWQEETACDGSLPIARHEAAYVAVKDKFYLLGGRRVQQVSIYDPVKQTWTQGSKPPIELHHFQPVVWEDEIWVGGAFTGKYPAETPVPHFFIYNPANDTWRQGPDMPADRQRGAAGMVIYQERMYMVCGLTDGHRSGHSRWLDVYDPKLDTWEALPDAPRARDHFQATATENHLYVLGGRRSKAPKKV